MFAFTRIKHPSFFYNPALFYLCISLIFNIFVQQINDNSMLNPQTGIKFSDYNSLYDILIPQDSKYRQLNELIDFASIRKELVKNYSKNMGREAIDPIILFKYLLLKTMHPVSDRDLIARSRTDMAYKYFLGLRPEDDVIDPSLLTVFRRQRIRDINLMDLLLRSSLDKAKALGLIVSKKILVDSTHTLSVFRRYTPAEAIKHRSGALLQVIRATDMELYKLLPAAVVSKNADEMIDYAERLLNAISKSDRIITPGIEEGMNYLQEALADIETRAMVCRDPDARSGHKDRSKPFTGYKVHIAETENGFITATTVTSGDKDDGSQLSGLIEKTEENGVKDIECVIADTAYSSKDNISACKEKNIKLVAPLNPTVNGFRDKNDGFIYNKDADCVTCPAGEISVKKRLIKYNAKKKCNGGYEYRFDIEKCKHCPLKEGCYKDGAESKTYMIRILSEEHARQKEFQKTDEFKRDISIRKRIESKNSELKNRLGLKTTISFGMESLEIQTAVAVFYVNLKRIMTLKAAK